MQQSFRDTGLSVILRAPVRRFAVFGERSSGTNFARRLIEKNTTLIAEDGLGWKHGHPAMVAIPPDVAVICVVRDARSWVRSMHARPWHCTRAMQELGFSAFLRAEWQTVLDRPRYFPQVEGMGARHMPLQADRDPMTGKPFADIFALRRSKLSGLFSFLSRDCTIVFTRLEAIQSDPKGWVGAVCAGLEVPPSGAYDPVQNRLGQRFQPAIEPRPPTPKAVSAVDLEFLKSRLDLRQEAAMGYDYS